MALIVSHASLLEPLRRLSGGLAAHEPRRRAIDWWIAAILAEIDRRAPLNPQHFGARPPAAAE